MPSDRRPAGTKKPTASQAPPDIWVNDPTTEPAPGPQADALEPRPPLPVENPRSPPNHSPGKPRK